ncbi:MAG: GntR family transcriptional regulator, partial [Nocardia sp.]|uniref:GntR family transcriptional regulator n=1 Tax=Nocardia sp. TaxID=1821 RepID=UPI00262F9667
AEGMVYRVPGRGTFTQTAHSGYVRQVGSIDDLMGLSEDTRMAIVTPLTRRVDLINAGRLRLDSDSVYALELVRTHDGTRFCLTKVFLPPNLGKQFMTRPELTTLGSESDLTVIGLIDAAVDKPISEARQSITVEVAGPHEAQHLGCAVGHPLLRIDRLYLDTEGSAVELATSHFLPEHYSYRINLRRGG